MTTLATEDLRRDCEANTPQPYWREPTDSKGLGPPVTPLDILNLAALFRQSPEQALKLAEEWSKSK